MKQRIGIIAAAASIIVVAVMALADVRTDITLREVRDPVQLRTILNANAAAQVTGTNLPANTVTKSSSVTTNATVTLSPAAITATAVVTKQTAAIYDSTGFACTNAAGAVAAVVTNATVAVTVVNGGVVLTNMTITVENAAIDFVNGCATNAP